EKVALLSNLLRRLAPDEVAIGVAYLSGHLRQGRIGLGWSALRAASDDDADAGAAPTLFDAPASAPEPLTLGEVDDAFARIAALPGSGAGAARARLLRALFRRAAAVERAFLVRLVMGELRQGALGGLMADAVARASEVPLAEIRRAAMFSGDLEPVAVA